MAQVAQLAAHAAQLRDHGQALPRCSAHGPEIGHGRRCPDALATVSSGHSDATARQYTLRIKSLLSYAHKVGYTPFNAGAVITIRSDAGNRGATLAKRIVTETEVALLIRAAPSKRDRVMVEVAYAGGLRVSELVDLNWADVLPRDQGRVQLNVLGKGGKVRQVVLPEVVSRALLSLRGAARAPHDPVFVDKKGQRMYARAVHRMI